MRFESERTVHCGLPYLVQVAADSAATRIRQVAAPGRLGRTWTAPSSSPLRVGERLVVMSPC